MDSPAASSRSDERGSRLVATCYAIAAVPLLLTIVFIRSEFSEYLRENLGPVRTALVLVTCVALTFVCGLYRGRWLYRGIIGRGHLQAVFRGLVLTAAATIVVAIEVAPLTYLLAEPDSHIGFVRVIVALPLLVLFGLFTGLALLFFTLPYGLLATLIIRLILWRPEDDPVARIGQRLHGEIP